MTVKRPAPIKDIPARLCKSLSFFFTDIDDTLTSNGLLRGNSFRSLWSLHENGIGVVPVTGRPAGWCDMIARMLPVDGVVGENGAFYFRYDAAARRMVRRHLVDEKDRANNRQRLDAR